MLQSKAPSPDSLCLLALQVCLHLGYLLQHAAFARAALCVTPVCALLKVPHLQRKITGNILYMPKMLCLLALQSVSLLSVLKVLQVK